MFVLRAASPIGHKHYGRWIYRGYYPVDHTTWRMGLISSTYLLYRFFVGRLPL